MTIKRYFILSIFLLASAHLIAQAPTLEWATSLGGSDIDLGLSVSIDDSSNVLSIGNFRDTVDFDPGSGTFQLIPQGLSACFVQKLDSTGNLLWAKSMSGSGHCVGNSITTDKHGNVYATGGFTGSVDFDPNGGTHLLSSNGHYDIFILKLDAAGNLIWAISLGAEKADSPQSITLNGTGNVYIAGKFSRTVDFDPGATTSNLTATGYYQTDAFILKLDTNGNFVWAKNVGSSNSCMANSIAVDLLGNVYTHGNFNGTVDFNPNAGIFNLTAIAVPGSSFNMFILKLDAAGNFIWAKQFEGTGLDHAYSIAIDKWGSIYTTGVFSETVDFDPSSGTHLITATGKNDTYIQKLDAAGNFVWAKNIGGTSSNCGGYAITTDKFGSVYTTGFFNNTVDFNPGIETSNLTAALSKTDIFIQKLNAQGNFVWAIHMGDTLQDFGRSIQVDDKGNVYSTGTFQGIPDFDPNAGISSLVGNGSFDIYIQKLNQCLPGNLFSTNDTALCINQQLTLNPQVPNATYLWQDNSTGPVYTPTQSGTYWVTATTNKCTFNDTIAVSFNPFPVVNLGNDTSLCPGKTLALTAETTNATYLWQNNSTSSDFTVTTDGTYWIEITVNNCSTTDSIIVLKEECEHVLELPNVFTPNNDGINDLFIPVKSEGIGSMNTSIYNRWGNKIFATQNLRIEWDGQNFTAGLYYWIVEYTDSNGEQYTQTGYVTLLK